jgi:hypothetical protein
MTAAAHSESYDFRRSQILSLAVGVLALAACVVGWAIDPILFFRSYLASFVFWVGLALGSLGVLMMQYVTGGRWGRILQRPLESAALTLPLLAILLIPILVGMHDLYPWTNADVMAADPVLQKKQV